jgi:hypothetical protein
MDNKVTNFFANRPCSGSEFFAYGKKKPLRRREGNAGAVGKLVPMGLPEGSRYIGLANDNLNGLVANSYEVNS